MNLVKKHLVKLLSIVIATILWAYVINSSPIEIEREVQLQIIPPTGLSLSKLGPETIKLNLVGPKAFIKSVYAEDIVYYNLKNKKYKGNRSYRFSIQEKDLDLPLGVKLKSVQPSRFKLTFEPTLNKKVQVIPNLVGKISKKYRLVSYKIKPKFVMVKGPVSVVKSIQKLETLPINLGEKTSDETIDLGFDQLDSRFSFDRDQVQVELLIKATDANLNLKKIPISFLSMGQKFFTKNRLASLSVLLEEESGFALTKKNVKIVAEIPKKKGSHKVKLKVNLPDGVHLVKVYPEQIKVIVK